MATDRIAEVKRKTAETVINVRLEMDGEGTHDISTGIAFFDHMLTLFSVHGFFDLSVKANGDTDIDFHHTVEDVGLVMGDVFSQALGDRKGIIRYGHAVTPMDDALAAVTIDLSNRPYLVFNVPPVEGKGQNFNLSITKEFFRAFATRGGMNLHINVMYGENEHHVIESIFKAVGRAMDQAAGSDERITGIRSSKGSL
ncbi:MAG: imidazoleglycerol-phosphate dehydratase HisB [Desulfobacterales bacterium]